MPVVKRYRSLALIAPLALVTMLAACGKTPDSPTESNEATLAAPDADQGVAASDGRIVLPVIAGRPAAVYFTVRNDGAQPITLTSVAVAEAAKAEMHQTNGGTMAKVDSLPIDPGASMVFAPGGLHVMAFDVSKDVQAGGTVELTLGFSDGGKLSLPLRVEAMGVVADGNAPAGEASDAPGMDGMSGHDMEGHDMQGMHH
jgi:copper(I)-binding protein